MKQRLDELMVVQGLAGSRKEALALVMAGKVSADGRRLEKPGLMVDVRLELHLKAQSPYVSRAGEKLASVVTAMGLEFAGKIVLDVGSSTGGFTDFVLQAGAERVYCVDVGTGQLAYKLRQDPRVVLMERTDIRDVTVADDGMMPEPADIAVVDVSFISLVKVLDAVVRLVKPNGLVVAMAKPQFEASKPVADRYSGVIPMGEVRDEILESLREWLRTRFRILAEHDSGVAGMRGNVERFMMLKQR